MLPALTAAAQAARVAALREYAVLDSPREERYDALARLTARSTGAPLAAVAFADAERLWFKSEVGTALGELPLCEAFCVHALAEASDLLVVPDLLADPRFADSPFVIGDAQLRFYAARVLRDAAGTALGTLCVFDTVVRGLAPAQEDALHTLAEAVQAQLELGRRPLPTRVEPARTAELHGALERDQLVPHFQPLWRVRRGSTGAAVRLVGAEALVRWEHPERGTLLPGAFLPDVEESGLSTALGEVVLRRSLEALGRWEAEGRLDPSFRLHVNVAASQLHAGGVADLVRRLGAETGAPLDRLCLEITETALLDARAFPPEAAQEIVDLGVRLVLDDFGTGYSSLTLLRRYPLAGVKVDRSFVQGLGVDREDEVIVAAVVGMARQLGLEAVCEGVETLEQLDHVLATGASAVQGFLLGRASAELQWDARLLPAPRRRTAAS